MYASWCDIVISSCTCMQLPTFLVHALMQCTLTCRRQKPHVPKELLPPEPHTDRHTHLERHHPKGFSLAKVLPLSGVLCFGSYCNFNTRARVSCVLPVFLRA
jgi:hypothetical protein